MAAVIATVSSSEISRSAFICQKFRIVAMFVCSPRVAATFCFQLDILSKKNDPSRCLMAWSVAKSNATIKILK